jgi:alpha-1,3-mannosyltransferase
MTRLSLRRVQGVICDSEQDLAALSTITDPQKLQLIPNGVPVEQLAQYQIVGRDRNLLLAVGQLTERKRPDLLLPVLAELVRQRPLARLLFIGPDKEGIQTSLRKQITALGLQKYVVFTGPISDTNLYNYLGRGAVWLSASAYEGFGIALAEAMAAGCVPLVSPLPPFRKMLGADADALIMTFDDPVLTADRILAILNLTDAARTAVTTRLRRQVADFSWTAVAEKTLKVCETAILANN